jgi:hypothetical protein
MKKRTLKLAALSLMMTAMLFNCKDDDDKTDPKTPDTDITNKINALNLPAFTPAAPVAVTRTPGAVVPSAKTTTLGTDLAAMSTTGVVPASLTEANSVLKSALSASDLATLGSVSPATLEAMKTGGEIPADLKAVIAKAYANASLAAYLPKVTAPTVAGVAVKASATRTGGTEAVEKTEEVLVDDACITAANALFTAAKGRLDASRTTQEAAAAQAYATALAAIPTAQTACGTTATAAGVTARATATTIFNQYMAALTANQAALGDQYADAVLAGYTFYFAQLTSANELEALDKVACASIATASTTAAATARDANMATIKASYDTALAQATTLRNDAIASCHNQGGGN